jgi:hypothetical protein
VKAKLVNQILEFQRGKNPMDILRIGYFEKYMRKFIEKLDKLQGNDGFPWDAYSDYVIEKIEKELKIGEELRKNMINGLTPSESAEKMKKNFRKGMKF